MKNKQLISILILFLVILTSCNPYKYPLAPNLKNVEYNVKDFDSITGYLNEYRKAFDVKFYNLDLAIHPSKKTIEGSVDITFKIVNATNKIQIELASNFDVSSITDSKSKSLNFSRKGKVILIDFNKIYQIGETETIKVNYSGKPQVARKPPWRGGFVWDSNKGKPYVGVACEDDGASIWWPLKDHISDKPDSVRLSFTIPKGLFCVSNGRLVDRQSIGDNQEKFIWKTSYPINTYNVSFYIGDYRHFQIPYTNNTGEHLLDFYVLPENIEVAKEHFKQSLDVIRVFEELFGEYPWWKDGDIYSKGAITLHTLRMVIDNDSTFFNILYRFATEYSDTCVTTQDFIDLVNELTQSDYNWLFEQLLYRAEAPTLLYQIKYISSNNYDLLYKWENSTTEKSFKLPVHLIMDNENITIFPTHKVQKKKISDWVNYRVVFNIDQFIVFKKTKF